MRVKSRLHTGLDDDKRFTAATYDRRQGLPRSVTVVSRLDKGCMLRGRELCVAVLILVCACGSWDIARFSGSKTALPQIL